MLLGGGGEVGKGMMTEVVSSSASKASSEGDGEEVVVGEEEG